ncbi:uncharacterized protein CLUP02_08832 [Colletotrichum lupini]|uniref:Uncharacterized protein n=1 Tax=Colletotrichum lupini TaxID=145971 RepID=A0A9Q8STK8_9PEZI|nr:uncharacterized protein CLUP02_08832 [Colletotrichum lupini]UQC83337.1 hypothetical protein CLUP02_08832 [Colletotrichum lupini]
MNSRNMRSGLSHFAEGAIVVLLNYRNRDLVERTKDLIVEYVVLSLWSAARLGVEETPLLNVDERLSKFVVATACYPKQSNESLFPESAFLERLEALMEPATREVSLSDQAGIFVYACLGRLETLVQLLVGTSKSSLAPDDNSMMPPGPVHQVDFWYLTSDDRRRTSNQRFCHLLPAEREVQGVNHRQPDPQRLVKDYVTVWSGVSPLRCPRQFTRGSCTLDNHSRATTSDTT